MTPHARPAAWEEVAARHGAEPTRAPGRVAVLVRSLVPGLLVAALLVLLDRPAAAVAVVVLSTAISIASALSERFHAQFQRVLQAVAHGVAVTLSIVFLGLVEALVIAPVSLGLWLFRRDPLRLGPSIAGDAWALPSAELSPQRPYTVEPLPPPATGARRVARAVPRVAGWVVIVLLLDLALGSIVSAIDSSDGDEGTVAERVAEATSDQPWFADYLEELQGVQQDFAPFVQTTTRDVEGRYINLRDGVRRSYEPAGDDGDLPLVLFFGGTNLWGEGQRDDHTIPSEIARLAEQDGHPVRVRNFAQRGDVNFAAVLRFERALADADDLPDLVVFADGPDDHEVQRQFPSADPSQHGLATARESLLREPPPGLWQRYADASLVHRAVERTRVLFSFEPAWAGTTDTVPVATERTRADLAADTASVYERGRRLALHIAENHGGVPVRFHWLPIEGGDRAGSTYGAVADLLDPSVIDLRDALDDPGGPVYLDGAQVNERGARLVAEAMYQSLRPEIEALGSGG